MKNTQIRFFFSIFLILCGCVPLFAAQPDSLSLAAIDSVRADSLQQPHYNSGFDTTLFYDARIIETALDSSCYYLRGDAVVRYQKMKLTAALITINQDDETITAEGLPDTSWVFNADSTEKTPKISMKGTPVFMEGSEDIRGFKLIYNYRTQKGRVIRGGSEYQTGKYTGAQIKKVSKDVFNVSDARFTTCEIEDHPHFYFKSRRLKMISNKEIIARPLVMYIADVPVAALPFVFYSNVRGRHSGLVIPTYGNSASDGRYLRGLGYYWAPSAYFDARLKGNYYEKSGWLLDGQFRYNKRYVMNGSLAGSITKKDYVDVGGSKQNRWDLRVIHNQQIGETAKLQVNGKFISDKSYYTSYSSNMEQRLNRQMRSNATFTKSWPGAKNNLTINASHTNYLDSNTETLILPQISFYHTQRPLFPKKESRDRLTVRRRDAVQEATDRWYNYIYYSYNSRLINQTNKGEDDPVARNISHNVSLSMNSPSKLFGILNWNHSVNYKETWFDRYKDFYYDQAADTTGGEPLQSRVKQGFSALRTFNYSMGANTKLYGYFPVKIADIVAFRHVCTPSVSLGFTPDFTSTDWGYYDEDVRDSTGTVISGNTSMYKYFGGSASSGQATLGFNLGNVFQMKTASIVDGREQEKKTDLFTMNFNTGYNFRADSLGLSPLSTSISANPKRNISLRMSARHDFYKYDTALNNRVNQLAAPRLTSFIFGTTLRLQSKKKKTDERDGDKRERSEDAATEDIPELFASDRPEDQYDNFVDDDDRFAAEKLFSGSDINWSANLSLDYSYYSSTPLSTKKTFYLRLSNIQVKLTKHWTVNYQAQYDLVNREMVSQIFNFRRDLHCWDLSFRWVPSGPYKEYFFKINIKSPELRDIKVEKRGGRKSYYSY